MMLCKVVKGVRVRGRIQLISVPADRQSPTLSAKAAPRTGKWNASPPFPLATVQTAISERPGQLNL
jgi:hypothetical protein